MTTIEVIEKKRNESRILRNEAKSCRERAHYQGRVKALDWVLKILKEVETKSR